MCALPFPSAMNEGYQIAKNFLELRLAETIRQCLDEKPASEFDVSTSCWNRNASVEFRLKLARAYHRIARVNECGAISTMNRPVSKRTHSLSSALNRRQSTPRTSPPTPSSRPSWRNAHYGRPRNDGPSLRRIGAASNGSRRGRKRRRTSTHNAASAGTAAVDVLQRPELGLCHRNAWIGTGASPVRQHSEEAKQPLPQSRFKFSAT